MSAQETENQAGSAGIEGGPDSVSGGSAVVNESETVDGGVTGNDVAADAAAESVSTETSDTLAGAAGPDASLSGEPQPDAEPTAAEKLHAAAVAYIIAARVAGVDRVEYLEAKVIEIAD